MSQDNSFPKNTTPVRYKIRFTDTDSISDLRYMNMKILTTTYHPHTIRSGRITIYSTTV